ncbi:unnamed protein product, partial [Allacma fusca]
MITGTTDKCKRNICTAGGTSREQNQISSFMPLSGNADESFLLPRKYTSYDTTSVSHNEQIYTAPLELVCGSVELWPSVAKDLLWLFGIHVFDGDEYILLDKFSGQLLQ